MSDGVVEMSDELDTIDRQIAEKVMGWNHDTGNIWSNGGIEVLNWQPTRNIAQAWEVLEMIVKNVGVEIQIRVTEKPQGFRQVRWGYPKKGTWSMEAIECQIPLAICKVAVEIFK